MAAPTPVSAYLHAAAMVKAGVYLVALLAPAFAGVPGWRGLLLSLGLVTMLLGGWRALRQYDIKLLLAYGTVSQLGFLLVVVSVGTRAAALAGLAMLVAHALFKATLFLVVGIVDHQTGTRDLRAALGRRPVGAGRWRRSRCIAGASMAGLPPLVGFVAKESVFGALIDVARHGDGTGLGRRRRLGRAGRRGPRLGADGRLHRRFLWGAFATKPGRRPHRLGADRRPGSWPPRRCSRRSRSSLGFLGGPRRTLLAPYADSFPAGRRTTPSWRCGTGSGSPLALSALSLGLGLLLFWRRGVVRRAAGRAQPARGAPSAATGVDAAARPVGGRGHRPDPARLGGDLPRA